LFLFYLLSFLSFLLFSFHFLCMTPQFASNFLFI
jgi:hypothetical protein